MSISATPSVCFVPLRRPTFSPALLLAFLLLSLLAGPAQETPPENADEKAAALALSGAQEAIEREDYDTATTILEAFLFAHPGHAQALFNLAYVYGLQGRANEAMEVYRQTLEVEPELLPARMNLALLLLEDDKNADAAVEFRRIVKIDPENFAAHFYLGQLLEQLDRKDEALEHYGRAAELDRQAVEPRRAALRLLLVQYDWFTAQALLDQLLLLTPQDAELYLLRAQFLSTEGDQEKTLAAYEEYFEVAAQDPSAIPSTLGETHMRAGALARSLGKGDDALRHFRAALTDGGDSSRQASATAQAETLAWLERYEEALPLYEQAVTGAPDNLDLVAGLGFVYLQTKQYAKAVPPLAHVIKNDPRRVAIYNHLASALYLGGNLAGAIEVLDRRAQRAPETAGTLYLRAISHDKLGQCRAAIEYYQKFLDTKPSATSDEYFQSTGRLRGLKKTCREKRR
jgi:tetratricopeptide (TPR) repeat protein